mgnify:CR=1 FL=1
MNPLSLLFLLGLITYFIVQRAASMTRTPVWLLWLVAMAPAFTWISWVLFTGSRPPASVFFIPFVVCLLLYWILIQRGRVSPSVMNNPSPVLQEGESDPGITPEPPSPPEMARSLDKEEEASLQNCFPWSIYYLQSIEYRPQAVICRGQMRSKSEVVYQTISENIQEKFADRFYVVFQEGPNGKPFFVLVPNPRSTSVPEAQQNPRLLKEKITRPWLATALLLATFFTTTLAWQILSNASGELSLTLLTKGIPYALSLMAILGIHELAHYLAARRYRILTTLPYFLPFPPIPDFFPFGTFGACIRLKSPIPHRRALFDVGIAGPLAGFVVALPLLLWGLAHSDLVPLPNRPDLFNFQAVDPNFSLLLALLSKIALGSTLTSETAIKLHPIAVAGFLGIVVTAFNLMPVGQLDGGHLVHAMFGQRTGAAIGQVARLLMLLLSFAQPHLLLWAILLFIIPVNDEPALNDVTELDNQRDLWGLLALGILLLIILPTPNLLSRLLNI